MFGLLCLGFDWPMKTDISCCRSIDYESIRMQRYMTLLLFFFFAVIIIIFVFSFVHRLHHRCLEHYAFFSCCFYDGLYLRRGARTGPQNNSSLYPSRLMFSFSFFLKAKCKEKKERERKGKKNILPDDDEYVTHTQLSVGLTVPEERLAIAAKRMERILIHFGGGGWPWCMRG